MGVVSVQYFGCDLEWTFDLAVVTLTFKMLSRQSSNLTLVKYIA